MSRMRQSSKLRQTFSPEDVDDCVIKLFDAMTSTLGRPFRAARANVRNIVSQWDPLLHDSVEDDAVGFARSYIPSHFFDRFVFSNEVQGTEAHDAALKKFEQSVIIGLGCNEMLRGLPSLTHPISRLIAEMREFIFEVVGDLDDHQVLLGFKHGPGATVSVKRNRAYLDVKALRYDGSSTQRYLYEQWMRLTPVSDVLERHYRAKACDEPDDASCTLHIVPKKWNVGRVIFVPKTLSGFTQAGIGSELTKRLLSIGIDLQTQPKVHADLLKHALRYNLATVDWSSASDRIWTELVRLLFPNHWFWWFSVTRSTVATFEGKEYPLPMIGTMGNGYTFPLQTLIFRAFFHAIGVIHNIDDTAVSIFGDDCIVPVEMVQHIEGYATWLGWEMNDKKTFHEGLFRESCGTDMYNGRDVRPVMPTRPDWKLNTLGFKAFVYILYNTTRMRVEAYSVDNLDSINAWLFEVFDQFKLGKLHFVPPDAPDYSGVRIDEKSARLSSSVSFDQHGAPTFSCILNLPFRRYVWHLPYYVTALSGSNREQWWQASKWKSPQKWAEHALASYAFELSEPMPLFEERFKGSDRDSLAFDGTTAIKIPNLQVKKIVDRYQWSYGHS